MGEKQQKPHFGLWSVGRIYDAIQVEVQSTLESTTMYIRAKFQPPSCRRSFFAYV